MSRDGSGVYDLPEAPFVDGTTIDSTAVNSDLADIAAGLTQSLSKDGQTVPTANLPMGGFRHTGVGTSTSRTHYLRTDQYIDGSLVYAEDGGSADAYSITLSPGITSYTEGSSFWVKIANTNLTTTPTFFVNGLTPGTITWPKGSALAEGDLPANAVVELSCAAVSTGTPTWHLMTVANPPIPKDLLTTRGDMIRRGASGPERVGLGTAGQLLGSDGTDAKWTALRGYLAGLNTSNNSGTPNTKIDVAAGICADDTSVQMLSYAGGTLDCSTTGANALDTGSLANSTWYHLFVIGKTDGTTALLASTSLSSPTFPSGYTLKRRLMSFLTDGSAHIVAYFQLGDRFLWKSPPNDQNPATIGTTAALYALSVPSGLAVVALVRLLGLGYASFAVYSPNQNTETTGSQVPPANLIPLSAVAGNAAAGNYEIVTDTSRRIAAVSDTVGASLYMTTEGWLDRRGWDS